MLFSSTRRNRKSLTVSEGLHNDRVQQGHVLSSSDGQFVCSVVVDDLGDSGERRTVFPEDVTAVSRLSELHVHESFATPGTKTNSESDKSNLMLQLRTNSHKDNSIINTKQKTHQAQKGGKRSFKLVYYGVKIISPKSTQGTKKNKYIKKSNIQSQVKYFVLVNPRVKF